MQDDHALDFLFDENPVGHYEDWLHMEFGYGSEPDCHDEVLCDDEELMLADACSENFPF